MRPRVGIAAKIADPNIIALISQDKNWKAAKRANVIFLVQIVYAIFLQVHLI